MSSPTPAVPDPTSSTPAARPRRPWRDNLEAFGVAILAAVLLKPMVIEAYQIPTPSMQPTLMGSPVAGIYDRILVDKVRYELSKILSTVLSFDQPYELRGEKGNMGEGFPR